MISRNICRFNIPTTHQILRAVKMRPPAKQTITLSRTIPTTGGIPRWYSEQQNFETLPVVEFDYVKSALSKNDVVIIDVREPDEVKEYGKIPNSINIPLGTVSGTLSMSEKDFQQTFNRPKPRENSELIFYCMIGKRSAKAQQSALNLGYKNAKNYLGSWTDWASKTQ